MTASGSAPTPVGVLIVEDNHVDANLVRYALDSVLRWPTTISVVEDGDQALDYLTQTGQYSAAPRPDLVVLDLNLPKRTGTEVLRVIRSTDDLRMLKVVVLSSSPLDIIENQVRDAHVKPDCYFTKPLGLDDFLAIGDDIRRCYEA